MPTSDEGRALIERLLQQDPYALDVQAKEQLLLTSLTALTRFHRDNCSDYEKVVSAVWGDVLNPCDLAALPYLPVGLFKQRHLKSVAEHDVFKVLNSSGTSGAAVSKIYLDRATAELQSRVLARLVKQVLGAARLPMLILDSKSVLTNRLAFSARVAGILGFSMFGRDVTYALDDEMNLNRSVVADFLHKHSGAPIAVFGFTYMVWKHLYLAVQDMGFNIKIPDSVLIHGGGWKNLEHAAVTESRFNSAMMDELGMREVVNYYGMVEQVGSIYFKCAHGFLHCPVFSDVLIRDPVSLEPVSDGSVGLIQTVSLLPWSYPGHSILTEDVGVVHGNGTCACGRGGRIFSVLGRQAQAEVRGCSDTYTG